MQDMHEAIEKGKEMTKEKKRSRLGLWFASRGQMKEKIWLMEKLMAKQEKQLDIQIHEAVKKIEELDQHKLYVILDKYMTEQEHFFLKQMLAAVKRNLRWTIPNILLLNRPLRELSMKELKQLIKTKKMLEANK